MIHINPKTYSLGHFFPFTQVFPNTLFAFSYELSYTILFDVLLTIQTQFFFNFELNRKSMCIPAGFARDIVAFHRTIAGNHVFNNTRQNMAGMWFSIRSRWSFIKRINLITFALRQRLVNYIVLFPKFQHFQFSWDKVQTAIYFFIHSASLFPLIYLYVHFSFCILRIIRG